MTTSTQDTKKDFWQSRNPQEWRPFEWTDPGGQQRAVGEIAIARTAASSGKHLAGMWRSSATTPGANPDGSISYEYSAPQGDECMIILEGNATVTVHETGEKYDLTPGTIVIQPKDLSVTWDIAAPYLKKFLVIWDSPNSVSPDPLTELIIGHVNDNPPDAEWEPYWTNGQAYGEMYFLTRKGTTGTLNAAIWRAGRGFDGCTPDGGAEHAATPWVPVDETEYLLEGRLRIREDETGEEHQCLAGDILGFTKGTNITWLQEPQFMKKFVVVTDADVLES